MVFAMFLVCFFFSAAHDIRFGQLDLRNLPMLWPISAVSEVRSPFEATSSEGSLWHFPRHRG